MFDKRYKIAWGISAITLIWMLCSCANQQHPLQQAPEEPPPPVELKIETPASEPTAAATPKSLEIPEPAIPKPVFFHHKVRWPEETYSHIAKWYTGTVNNWKTIAKENPELDPKKIDIGDTILIPKELMISNDPMPRSFVRASVRKKDLPVPSSKTLTTPSESPKLFDSKDSEPSSEKTDAAKLFGPVGAESLSTPTDETKLFGPIE